MKNIFDRLKSISTLSDAEKILVIVTKSDIPLKSSQIAFLLQIPLSKTVHCCRRLEKQGFLTGEQILSENGRKYYVWQIKKTSGLKLEPLKLRTPFEEAL